MRLHHCLSSRLDSITGAGAMLHGAAALYCSSSLTCMDSPEGSRLVHRGNSHFLVNPKGYRLLVATSELVAGALALT